MHSVRTRAIRVRPCGVGSCCLCGKDKTKRVGKFPAPIMLLLRYVGIYDLVLPEPRAIMFAICMACAKRLSSRLDAVIDQIESRYIDERGKGESNG